MSQQTQVYSEPTADFTRALDLFDAQRYSAAEHLFEQVAKVTPTESSMKTDADYYVAVCSMYLFHDDAERRLTDFIEMHPQSPKVKKIDFLLGNYAYRKRKFKDAIVWYYKVEPSNLDKDEAQEFYYKRGYSDFYLNRYDSAKADLAQVKDAGSTYSPAATYYYGYIAYKQKNYQTAINCFITLKSDARFSSVVPFYIAQLYYLQGEYDKVPENVIPLIDSSKKPGAIFNVDQTYKLIAESYYHLGKYSDAILYYIKFSNGGSLMENEAYELAYCYYAVSKYKDAIPWFQNAAYGKDSLAQNALYYLACCYLKSGNKQSASNEFYAVYKMNYDPKLKEDALFNYAKLSYEISFDPFNEAIQAFNEYLADYPNSPHKEEIYRYMVNAYLGTRNYPAALASLDKIKNWDTQLQSVYQRLTYYRGVDLFNNNQMGLAATYFDNSLKFNFDQKLHLLAYYWKAEALYREKKYKDAVDAYNQYIDQPEAFSSVEYNLSEYGMGYAYFEMKDYENANLAFRKYADKETDDKKRLSDAYNRIGDSYFVRRDFASSIPYYSKNVELNVYEMDYAAYQKALAQGVMHNLTDKISTLEDFLKQYPKSSYRPSAMAELANTYELNSQPDQALAEYQQVLDNYPNSQFTNHCLLQKGMIYFNQNQNDKAQAAWDEVVKRDRNSADGAEALNHIKMLYTSTGQVDKMQDYFKNVGVNLSQATIDSATFSVVKSEYLAENYSKVVPEIGNYLQKFPQGIFSGEARFYRAECLYKAKSYDSALVDYAYVAKLPKEYYTETALAKASKLEYEKKDYAQALDYFNQLAPIAQFPANLTGARIGKMRCDFFLKKYDATIGASDTVLQTPQLDKQVYAEADLLKAKSYFQKEVYDSSEDCFKRVMTSTNSELEAEAKYNVAYIEYLKSDIPASEKTVFDLVNQEPSYPTWMAKGLIVLSDDYVAAHDNFQARQTLNIVIDNASDTATISLAKRKLDMIKEKETNAMPKPIQPDMLIPFSADSTKYNNLFKQ
ncbi:MAG: tetratricopeptide repeat protein [Bacteroidia bacterium]